MKNIKSLILYIAMFILQKVSMVSRMKVSIKCFYFCNCKLSLLHNLILSSAIYLGHYEHSNLCNVSAIFTVFQITLLSYFSYLSENKTSIVNKFLYFETHSWWIV